MAEEGRNRYVMRISACKVWTEETRISSQICIIGWCLMSRSSLKHSTCRFGIMINAERDGEHKGCNHGFIERELGRYDCVYCQNYIEKPKRWFGMQTCYFCKPGEFCPDCKETGGTFYVPVEYWCMNDDCQTKEKQCLYRQRKIIKVHNEHHDWNREEINDS